MGYTPEEAIYKVDFSGTHLAGFELSVRAMSTDEILELTMLSDTLDENRVVTGTARVKAVDTLLAKFAEVIHSWNLEIPAGTPVPPTRENLGKQDLGRFVLPVLNMAIEAVVGVSDDLGKGSASGPPSPVASLPMEPS